MTADYRTVGAHQINKWLWSKLKDWEYKTSTKAFDAYGTATGKINLVPIIPAQQLPEFTNISGGAPFIVYAYTRSTSAKSFHMHSERATFVVYDNDEERLRAVHGYVFDLLRRLDVTADEINTYLGGSSVFSFKFVQASMASSPEPFTQEGGRQGATISISYDYTLELGSTGLRT